MLDGAPAVEAPSARNWRAAIIGRVASRRISSHQSSKAPGMGRGVYGFGSRICEPGSGLRRTFSRSMPETPSTML